VKNIFIDSDVILDALLKRQLFKVSAMNIIVLANNPNYKIFTSAVAFVNVHYFLDKYDKYQKFELLKGIRTVISIIDVTEKDIDMALQSGIDDFEDAVQYHTAKRVGVDAIITRNIKDYKHSSIPVFTPDQFLKTL
jgi:predicted nucleic acid-binding protein